MTHYTVVLCLPLILFLSEIHDFTLTVLETVTSTRYTLRSITSPRRISLHLKDGDRERYPTALDVFFSISNQNDKSGPVPVDNPSTGQYRPGILHCSTQEFLDTLELTSTLLGSVERSERLEK